MDSRTSTWHTPLPFRVIDTRAETHDVVTLRLRASDGFRFLPGQFNMLYAFGRGEIPISISGHPDRQDEIMHTIRDVGAVSEALCALRAGETLGLRGPFGNAWPIEPGAQTDLLLVAGGLGLAPLRPAILRLAERRRLYRNVWLLIGARTPDELVFADELDDLRAALETRIIVDRASNEWKGRVGVVPALLSEIDFDPKATRALLCGPEIMMRFTARELLRRGMASSEIHLSMERNMKCAVGSCGHCQLGPHFICKDGPVLSLARLQPWLWRSEI